MPHAASFDVQIFANGNWRTLDVFRTRDEAIRKAQILEIGPTRQAVRVLHESYDPLSGRFRHQTVFRRSALNQERIGVARTDHAVARLLRNRRQRAVRTGKTRPSGDWPLFSGVGVRILALMTGSAVAMAFVERLATS